MTPEEFDRLIPAQVLQAAIQETPRPCYLFFRRIIERQVERLRAALGSRFHVHYAVKANPHPEILRTLRGLGTGADVASEGEISAALDAGFAPEHLEFSGPGKTRSELERAVALNIGCTNVESLAELDQLIAIAQSAGRRARIGLRVNPMVKATAGLRMAGATQFGLDEGLLDAALGRIQAAQSAADLRGVHVHVGSQILESAAALETFRAGLDLAARVQSATGQPLQKLNFGGGWGVTYFEGQRPLDLEAIGAGVDDLIRQPAYSAAIRGTSLIVEPGRFLVAESGLYVAQVLYVKESRGEQFAIVDGGMHHNYLLAGGMGQVIRRNFFLSILPQHKDQGGNSPVHLNIAGSLCTPQDVLAREVPVDRPVHPGDNVVFFNSGAYGLTASPINFLGHALPEERLVP